MIVNYVGPTRTRSIQIMSLTAWGLVMVLFVSAVFGNIVRMYVLISIGCAVIVLSVWDTYKSRVKTSSADDTIQVKSPMSSDNEADAFSEDIVESRLPSSSTPGKIAVMETLRPVEISSAYPSTIQTGLIPSYNAEVRHMDGVECKESTDVSTSITTSHGSALLDDSHVIQSAAGNDHNIDDIGSHDHSGLHDHSGSHDQTDFANEMQNNTKTHRPSFGRPSHQNKQNRITHIFGILILICMVTLFYHNPWIAICLLLPIGCTVLIRRIIFIDFVNEWLNWAWLRWKNSSLHSIIFPPLVCHVYNAYAKLDKKVIVLSPCLIVFLTRV